MPPLIDANGSKEDRNTNERKPATSHLTRLSGSNFGQVNRLPAKARVVVAWIVRQVELFHLLMCAATV